MNWFEKGLVSDAAIRVGIRRLLRQRKQEIHADDAQAAAVATDVFIDSMNGAKHLAPIALLQAKANEQNYEVPADFYAIALGRHLKYSSCYWDESTPNLDSAEAAALTATCLHAQLDNGQDILELGCGWGSLTLWMAAAYPGSKITAVSNTVSQREYILSEVARNNLVNVTVITADMNSFNIDSRFDRVVSVEMFECMRNWRLLFEKVSGWLKPEGKFFMHVFVHRSVPYVLEERGDSDWMRRHFFSSGMMPSEDLAARFQEHLRLSQRWRWDGKHYAKTAEAWLANVDARRDDALEVLGRFYASPLAAQWLQRWRIFFMACAELFACDGGQQWWVSHYLFERAAKPGDPPAVAFQLPV